MGPAVVRHIEVGGLEESPHLPGAGLQGVGAVGKIGDHLEGIDLVVVVVGILNVVAVAEEEIPVDPPDFKGGGLPFRAPADRGQVLGPQRHRPQSLHSRRGWGPHPRIGSDVSTVSRKQPCLN
jgi:hypothetical protein